MSTGCVTHKTCAGFSHVHVMQILEPLRMSCGVDIPRIMEPALACLHKLVHQLLITMITFLKYTKHTGRAHAKALSQQSLSALQVPFTSSSICRSGLRQQQATAQPAFALLASDGHMSSIFSVYEACTASFAKQLLRPISLHWPMTT